MTAAALYVAAALALGAEPYVRTKATASDPRSHCLLWLSPEITFRQNPRGNAETTGDSELVAFGKSLEAWNAAAAPCSSILLREGPRTSESAIEIGWVEGASDNENLIVYRPRDCDASGVVPSGDACWSDQTCQSKYDCWDQADATIAVTTTTYDLEVGRVHDSDIEGNAAWFVFTTVDSPPCLKGQWSQSCVATDVQNTMTHELGHSLGLDHTSQTWSTMFARAESSELSKRTIDVGSQEFLCEAYPREGIPLDCITVRAQSALGQSVACAAAPGTVAGAALLAAWTALRRRRRR